ncbi:MAG: DciA family protein [Pseudomonadota bacterium]
MGELTEILSKSISDTDRGAIVAANLRDDGELVVICASSAWAARLRYQTDILLKAARDAGVKASACRVRVAQS